MGPEGLTLLQELLQEAKKQGYYVLLDGVEVWTMQAAQFAADMLFTEQWLFDGLIVSAYIGSDGLKPYMALLKEQKKMLFAVLRTANKTAPELQDLLTGTRLVHMAAADVVNRLGEQLPSRCGYWQIGSVGAANAADSLRSLRAKYQSMFLLVDGMDYSNANAKNCSYAFDKLGHGAAVCAGTSVTAAWQAEETDGQNYVELAVQAAERMKKNLLRYITIL
jgi:orotidine-5'-phosphate decarboxylase